MNDGVLAPGELVQGKGLSLSDGLGLGLGLRFREREDDCPQSSYADAAVAR